MHENTIHNNMNAKIFFLCLFFSVSAFAVEKTSLAVSDLAAQGIKENEAAVISEQLRVELSKAEHIRLIERSQMKEILKEQGFQQSGCTDDACAVEVGQLLGVKNIVIGSIGTAGSYTVLTVRIIDVGTGEIVVNESVRTRGGIDEVLKSGVKKASAKLKTGLLPDYKDEKVAKNNLRKKLLIGGAGLFLAAGGIASYFIFADDDNKEETKTPNVRFEIHE